jgi:hypothetical protein
LSRTLKRARYTDFQTRSTRRNGRRPAATLATEG